MSQVHCDVAVIGAGPGGLAAAAMLRRAGAGDIVVLEREAVGASWRRHYDRLHLHTVRWLSHLPGYRIPRRFGPWVARDDVIRYLGQYAAHHRLDVRTGVEVYGAHRDGQGWWLPTSEGEVRADYVVVATGYNHTPHIPAWPGKDDYGGELRHARDYRNGTPYRGRDVLVVGAGNTGAEIAVDLLEHGARRVRMAVRTPPHVIRREVGGLPSLALGVLTRHVPSRLADPVARAMGRLTIGDLAEYGLGEPARGLYTRVREGAIPIIDVGFVDRLKRGDIQVVSAVDRFESGALRLADGSHVEPDAVIVSTGFLRGLEPLVGHLGVLAEDGRPAVSGGRTHPYAPGLYFTGYTNPISGMFRELGIDARRIARAVSRDRGARPMPRRLLR